MQETDSYAKIDPMNDITQEWTKTKGIMGSVAEMQEDTVNGTIYRVDEKYIRLSEKCKKN